MIQVPTSLSIWAALSSSTDGVCPAARFVRSTGCHRCDNLHIRNSQTLTHDFHSSSQRLTLRGMADLQHV